MKIPQLFLVLIFFSFTGCNQEPAEELPLKEVFEDYFLIGAALDNRMVLGDDPKSLELAEYHFNSITPENKLKWERVHPEPGHFYFDAADQFVNFGEANNMFIVGHTLVWHNQTPDWVFLDDDGHPVSREELLERMRNHIHMVVGRYKGRIHGWDVVNEALNNDGTLRQSPWLEIIGEEYIAKAFQFAHEADPEAELYYNDYSLEIPEKREGAVRIAEQLMEQGIPITAIGTQGHYSLDWPSLDEIRNTISDISALGLDVMITELDLDVLPSATEYEGADINLQVELQDELNPYPDKLPEEMQHKLAERYADIFEIFADNRDEISRVTFWGVTDGDSWKNNWPVRGRTNYPLLFDRDGNPKLAFYAVVETVKN